MLVTSRDRAVGVTRMGLGRKECAIQMPPISTGCNPPRVPARHARGGGRTAWLSLLLYLHLLQRGNATHLLCSYREE